MDLRFTDDQEELRRSVRAFLGKECPVSLVRAQAEGSGGPEARRLWEKMVAADWPGLAIARDDGGVGLGFAELAVLAEEAGAALVPGPLVATTGLFVPTVAEVADPARRHELLTRVATGGATGTLAVAEGARGAGIGTIAATATPVAGGFALDGTKRFVLSAREAEWIAVVARLAAPAAGAAAGDLAVLVVQRSALQTTPLHAYDPTRSLCSVDLGGCAVAGSSLLGAGPQAAGGLRRAMEEGACVLALETLGACREMFAAVLAYAQSRRQFGAAIGSFQAVKHKLVDMFVSLEKARALAYYAVAAICEDAPDRAQAVAMAKAATDDCQRHIGQESIQTFGGIGFTWENDLQLFVKRAKTTGALLGDAHDHRRHLAATMGLGAAAS